MPSQAFLKFGYHRSYENRPRRMLNHQEMRISPHFYAFPLLSMDGEPLLSFYQRSKVENRMDFLYFIASRTGHDVEGIVEFRI
jgi:hypothetical protein